MLRWFRSALLLAILLASIIYPPGSMAGKPAIAPSTGLQLVRSDIDGILLSVDTGQTLMEQAAASYDLSRLALPGTELTEEPGMPQLPVYQALLGVPPGVSVSLEVSTGDAVTLPGAYRVSLAQFPQAPPNPLKGAAGQEDQGAGTAGTSMVQRAVPVPAEYPTAHARIAEEAWLRNQRVVRVEIFPIQYISSDQSVRWHQKLQVTLRFHPGAEPERASYSPPAGDDPFEPVYAQSLLNYDSARSWRAKAPEAGATPITNSQPALGPRLRIGVDHDGLYRLTYTNLQQAGVPVDTISPRAFLMTNQGRDVAIQVTGEADGRFDSGDSILFFGEKFRGDYLASLYSAEDDTWPHQFFLGTTPVTWQPHLNAIMFEKYTDENVYWLTWGGADGKRMPVADRLPEQNWLVQMDYLERVHAERNTSWWPWHFTNEETWFWDIFVAGGQPVTRSYTTTVSSPAASVITATLSASIVANSFSPDHHVQFYLNGNTAPVHDAVWGGPDRLTFTVPLTATLLQNGVNQLRLVAQQPAGSDTFLFDWFELAYPRLLNARDDRLAFSFVEQGKQLNYRLNGFSQSDVTGIVALDITDSLNPVRMAIATGLGYQFGFRSSHAGEARYLIAGSGGLQHPKEVRLASLPDLLAANNSADYIFITHRDFLTGTQALADLHAVQGQATRVVDVQDLYDEFNFGIYHPIAIKNFLRYAYTHWQVQPTYALLVGSGHFDLKGVYALNSAPLIKPVYMPPNLVFVDPWQGEVDSANLLANVSGADSLPDLVIGRLPVYTREQLDGFVQKVAAYQAGGYQPWQNNLLFVADDPDEAGNFDGVSNRLIDENVPAGYAVDTVYLSQYPGSGVVTATTKLVDSLNYTGTLLVNYIGHGSINRWTGNSDPVTGQPFFQTTAAEPQASDPTKNQIVRLNNANQLPVVLSMTCLDGYWYYPSASLVSMAAELVRTPGKGAISTFSPTGLGLAGGHDVMNAAFLGSLFNYGNWNLGLASVASKVALFATGRDRDLIDTYTIIGDPALEIPNAYQMSMSPAQDSKTVDPGGRAAYTLHVSNEGAKQDTFEITLSGNQWQVTSPITATLTAGASQDVQVMVTAPAFPSFDLEDEVMVKVQSRGDRADFATAILTTRTISRVYLPVSNRQWTR